MKCKRCKKTLQSDFKFCPWCGSKSANQKYYRRPDGLYEKSIVYDGKRHIFRARTEKELEKKIFAYNPESEQTKSGMLLRKNGKPMRLKLLLKVLSRHTSHEQNGLLTILAMSL